MKLIVVLALVTACSSKPSAQKQVRVAAASDLAKAFQEVGKEFQQRSGISPDFTFGSSGLLAKQIEQGAPYYLYASANKSFVAQVINAGKCDGATAKLYARGRIVVWTPSGGTAAPMKLADLTDSRFKKIAIANPEHAPYGLAAKQALEKTGVWDQLQDRLVLGENIQATMLYAQKKEVDAAIVALSLAVVNDGGTSLAIDQSLHDPLDQQLVVCGAGEEADAARHFADFISSREGREIMTRYGFLLPDEQMKQ